MSHFIHETAVLEAGAQVGCFSVVLENVRIGANCRIGHHVVIHPDTVIGNDVWIDDHAVVGKRPLKAAAMAIPQAEDLEPARIGAHALIGTGATVFRSARIDDHALIADYASVREESSIGAYTIIGRGVVVENKVCIGVRCKVEAGAFIAALSEIGERCFVAPEVAVTNDNFMGRTEERKKHFKGITIRNGGRIGANATLLPGIVVEADGVAAAGSVVTKDIPARKVVAGIPARTFRDVPPEQLLENQT